MTARHAHARRERGSRATEAARAPRRPPPLEPPPIAWRDPWVLLVALAVVPLAWAARTAALGEPFSDDFLFLDFSVLRHNPSWWTGGGGAFWWRPLARQGYFGLVGPIMLSHPRWIATLHALALAAAAVLLFRVLRRGWPAPAAAAAASFPVLLEAARVLLAWPSAAQDLGALLFLAIALLAAVHRRRWPMCAAALAAMLCKENAAPLALLVPFAPFDLGPRPWRAGRWSAGLTVGAWLALRIAVHVLTHEPGASAVTASTAGPLASRLFQSLALAAGDAFGITTGLRARGVFIAAALGCVALSLLWLLRRRGQRPGTLAWTLWGLAWFAAGAAPMAFLLPDWAPYRSVLAATGLGIAIVAPLASVRAAWLVPVVATRLAALLVAPQPPERLAIDASFNGGAMTYPRLAQLQRSVHEARRTLFAVRPTLAPHATVIREAWPRMTGVAFAGDLALHAWYRDTTIRWLPSEALTRADTTRIDAVLEFEPLRSPQYVSIEPASMHRAMRVVRLMHDQRIENALAEIAAAESLQADTACAQYFATLEGWRGIALLDLGRIDEAEAAAGRSLGHFRVNPDARRVIARARGSRGDWVGARDLLREQLVYYPNDAMSRQMYQEALQHAPFEPH
jgi:tetratricopeptide (TPR) repeat protein